MTKGHNSDVAQTNLSTDVGLSRIQQSSKPSQEPRVQSETGTREQFCKPNLLLFHIEWGSGRGYSVHQKRKPKEKYIAVDWETIEIAGGWQIYHLIQSSYLALFIYSQRTAGFQWVGVDETCSLDQIWLMSWDGLLGNINCRIKRRPGEGKWSRDRSLRPSLNFRSIYYSEFKLFLKLFQKSMALVNSCVQHKIAFFRQPNLLNSYPNSGLLMEIKQKLNCLARDLATLFGKTTALFTVFIAFLYRQFSLWKLYLLRMYSFPL